MFVSNFLVDGPKIRCGVDVDRGGFQVRDRLFQPEAERNRFIAKNAETKLREGLTD